MSKTYPANPGKTTPCKIDDEVSAAIGRIIRSFAELDNCLTLYLSLLINLEESPTTILLGRMNITGKIQKAGYLASLSKGTIKTTHKQLFDARFRAFLKCRNVLAHGSLLGKTDEGNFAFLINETIETDSENARFVVVAYSKETILQTADNMEIYMEDLIKELALQPLLDTRAQLPLLAHPKGRFLQRKQKKPEPQPQS